MKTNISETEKDMIILAYKIAIGEADVKDKYKIFTNQEERDIFIQLRMKHHLNNLRELRKCII
jgi:hypothetical protein